MGSTLGNPFYGLFVMAWMNLGMHFDLDKLRLVSIRTLMQQHLCRSSLPINFVQHS